METFSALQDLCAHKGQRRGALVYYFICAWINAWVNNRDAGEFRRHRAHYDVIVKVIRRSGHKTSTLRLLSLGRINTGNCGKPWHISTEWNYLFLWQNSNRTASRDECVEGGDESAEGGDESIGAGETRQYHGIMAYKTTLLHLEKTPYV